jgi:hypothetical protein
MQAQGQNIYLPLLNNLSAGQPSSLCLQYLQVKVPRINPLPAVVNAIIANKVIRIQSRLDSFHKSLMFPRLRFLELTSG